MSKSYLTGGCCLVVAALVGASGGCTRPVAVTTEVASPPGPSWFVDATEELGLDFVADPGPTDHFFMPQIMGAGAAFFDFNNDGRLDILLLQNAGANSSSTNRLYRQKDDGHFEDVTKGSGLDFAGNNIGVTIGDVNNDGWADVLITQYGGVQLLLNRGNGSFVNITKDAGLHNPHWGMSAAWLDYDGDGWLDLIVVNYLKYDPTWKCFAPNGGADYCHPSNFPGVSARLFRNLGRTGTGGKLQPGAAPAPVRFEDVSLACGIGAKPGPGLGVYCADFDGDGWIDICVANDGKPNHLWMNQKGKTFQEEAVPRGLAYNGVGRAEANMGIAFGDVDGDGLFDVFVTHLAAETNTLWKQGPRGRFEDKTTMSGLGRPRWRGTGFGTILSDFDNNGALDIAVVNGHIARTDVPVNQSELGSHWSSYAHRNQLFRNDGTGQFTDLSPDNAAFCGIPRVGRGLACGDINQDGALDLLVTNVSGRARLYRNTAPARGHWVSIRAIDPALERDALGAQITVQTGNRRLVRLCHPGGSYLCSSEIAVHFGLGTATTIDAIEVLWPDRSRERFAGSADQRLTLLKGQGKPLTP